MVKINIENFIPTASVDPQRVLEYSQMDPSNQPPISYIQIPKGKAIVDGHHRLYASLIRGDTEIEAIPSNLPLQTQKKWLKNIFG